jgi:hypothetical protein
MPYIIADPPDPPCYSPCSRKAESGNFKAVVLISFRVARGRFTKGCCGNPRGRARGIPNPKRRVADLRVRPAEL